MNLTSCAHLAKGMAKILLLSRRPSLQPADRHDETIVILANGPSLTRTLTEDAVRLEGRRLMTVNFAPNTPEFFKLKPHYHIMIDPVFFDNRRDDVVAMWRNLERVDWPMTLIVPCTAKLPVDLPVKVTVGRINTVGCERVSLVADRLYDTRRAMPRPRNVLVAALMSAIWLGFKTIYVAGADHSWTTMLAVDADNRVVSRQPHFYAEDEKERRRKEQHVQAGVKLHEMLSSYAVAFKSYWDIAEYARRRNCRIVNSTPGSFIDAFERAPIGD